MQHQETLRHEPVCPPVHAQPHKRRYPLTHTLPPPLYPSLDPPTQGKNFIDAAKAAGVKFIVFSSLEDEGEHDVPHLRSKAIIEAYLKSSGIPYATVRYPFYYENWVYFMPPRKDEGKDSYTLVSPTGQEGWHQMAVADGGPVVAKMLDDPAAYEGKCIGLAGEEEKGEE